MVFFIFNLVLMFALAGILYLMVRALPRVDDVQRGELSDEGAGAVGAGAAGAGYTAGRRSLLDRWAHSELPEKIDASFNSWFLKFLRKFKVFVLKLDNSITNHLRKISRENEAVEKKAAIDFREISGKGGEEEQE